MSKRQGLRACTLSHFSCVQPFVTLRATARRSWDFCDTNTEVGCHALLQGIFPTQGLNPGLLHRQVGCLPLSQLRSEGLS